jgi:hypothetical protein
LRLLNKPKNTSNKAMTAGAIMIFAAIPQDLEEDMMQ